MSVTSIGGDASQQWQALRESRADKTSANAATSAANRPPRGPPPAASDRTASVDAGGNPTGAGAISNASAKVITDLKALFISLQSGASSNPDAASATTAATATATGADATTGAAGATSVPGNPARVGGHHGGRHSHRPPVAGASSADAKTGASTSAATSATATAGQPAPKRSGGLLDELVGALKAYAASSNGNSAKAATGLNA